MRKYLKIFLVALLLVPVAAVFTACGNKSSIKGDLKNGKYTFSEIHINGKAVKMPKTPDTLKQGFTNIWDSLDALSNNYDQDAVKAEFNKYFEGGLDAFDDELLPVSKTAKPAAAGTPVLMPASERPWTYVYEDEEAGTTDTEFCWWDEEEEDYYYIRESDIPDQPTAPATPKHERDLISNPQDTCRYGYTADNCDGGYLICEAQDCLNGYVPCPNNCLYGFTLEGDEYVACGDCYNRITDGTGLRQRFVTECPNCDGTTYVRDTCWQCHGSGELNYICDYVDVDGWECDPAQGWVLDPLVWEYDGAAECWNIISGLSPAQIAADRSYACPACEGTGYSKIKFWHCDADGCDGAGWVEYGYELEDAMADKDELVFILDGTETRHGGDAGCGRAFVMCDDENCMHGSYEYTCGETCNFANEVDHRTAYRRQQAEWARYDARYETYSGLVDARDAKIAEFDTAKAYYNKYSKLWTAYDAYLLKATVKTVYDYVNYVEDTTKALQKAKYFVSTSHDVSIQNYVMGLLEGIKWSEDRAFNVVGDAMMIRMGGFWDTFTDYNYRVVGDEVVFASNDRTVLDPDHCVECEHFTDYTVQYPFGSLVKVTEVKGNIVVDYTALFANAGYSITDVKVVYKR